MVTPNGPPTHDDTSVTGEDPVTTSHPTGIKFCPFSFVVLTLHVYTPFALDAHAVSICFQGPPQEYTRFGPCNCICSHCHALFWYEERLSSSTRSSGPLYHRCCMGGKVRLLLPRVYPPYIQQLFTDPHFLAHIRAYNQMFSMTSLGANIDDSVNVGRGPYVFKVSGQIYHQIG